MCIFIGMKASDYYTNPWVFNLKRRGNSRLFKLYLIYSKGCTRLPQNASAIRDTLQAQMVSVVQGS